MRFLTDNVVAELKEREAKLSSSPPVIFHDLKAVARFVSQRESMAAVQPEKIRAATAAVAVAEEMVSRW
jgi:hypothetical protein